MKSLLASLFAFLIPALSFSDELPVEYFFNDPTFRQARLSPDGTHLAVLVNLEGTMSLAVVDLEQNIPRIVAREGFDITHYYWASDERLIYGSSKARDTEGDFLGGIFAVNRNGKNPRVLVHPPFNVEDSVSFNVPTTVYLGPQRHDPDHILVMINERSRRHPDVFRMNIHNGRTRRAVLNTHNFRGYDLDVDGEVRFGYQKEVEASDQKVFLRNPETDEWEHFISFPALDETWEPIDFSPKHDTFLAVTSIGADRLLLRRYNWRTGSSEIVYRDEDYDLADADFLFDRTQPDRCVGLYYEADKPAYVYFDKTAERMQKRIDLALPDTFNQIVNTDSEGHRMLILAASDRQMPLYYLLDLRAGNLELLESVTPWIDPKLLSQTRPIRFQASDGETVHGYLTLPRGYKEGTRVPLIVNPHGGPWARDTWRLRWYLDLEKQFYANRGFAVLQVNFRGSTGFGKRFYNAHIKNIGRMYDDMIEGVRWTIDQGFVDPEKIGITGASWGGYKTMLGLTRDPELFKFGINIFGVVDFPAQIRVSLKPGRNWKENYAFHTSRLGDPAVPEELAYLNKWSPIHAVDQIQSPVFIYHGVRDMNVDIEQSRMLISALRRAGKEFTHIIDSTEMHSIESEALRLRVYREIDKFILPFRREWGLISE